MQSFHSHHLRRQLCRGKPVCAHVLHHPSSAVLLTSLVTGLLRTLLRGRMPQCQVQRRLWPVPGPLQHVLRRVQVCHRPRHRHVSANSDCRWPRPCGAAGDALHHVLRRQLRGSTHARQACAHAYAVSCVACMLCTAHPYLLCNAFGLCCTCFSSLLQSSRETSTQALDILNCCYLHRCRCPCYYPNNAFSNKRWCCGDMRHMDLSHW